MKGQKAGVAKPIKDIEQKALFTYCYTQAFNLAVGDAIKSSEIVKEALETTHEFTRLIKKSPKRDAKLDVIKNEAKIISISEEYSHGRNSTVVSNQLDCLCKILEQSLGSIMNNYTYLTP